MNVREITPGSYGSLAHYFAVAIPLTAASVWILMAFQDRWHERDVDVSIWTRISWPVVVVRRVFGARTWAKVSRRRDSV